MENPPNLEQKKSEKELADFLLQKYPNEIKSIETFEGGIDNTVELKIKDEIEKNLLKLCLDYLHRPIIQDTFENDHPARRVFIKEITTNSSNQKEIQDFFDSNKMKVSHIRRICQLAYFIKDSLSQEVIEELDALKKITNNDEFDYSYMSDEDKIVKVKEADEFAKKIIEILTERYK